MRRPLFIAMIFLLLLRGWVGDVMATEMASTAPRHAQAAIEMIASDAHVESAVAVFYPTSGHLQAVTVASDCADHGKPGPTTEVADTYCQSCPACQACHTVALSSLVGSTASVSLPPALPHSPTAHFASAATALGQKPPIS